MKRSNRPAPRLIIAATLALALTFEALSFSAARVWVTPDSTAYITLAAGIAESFDFGQPLFQLRLPGYPMMLALIFRVFGDASPTALLAVQHAMVAGCALLATLSAWTLWQNRLFVCTVGLFSAWPIHLSGYANAVLTEVPYAFVVSACVYQLLKFLTERRLRFMLAASFAAGVASLVKDIGVYSIATCVLVALVDMGQRWRKSRKTRGYGMPARAGLVHWFATNGRGIVASLLPAIVVLTPFAINNLMVFGRMKANSNGGLLYYYRAACMDKLDSDKSPAVAYLRETVAQAREQGWIPSNATHHDYIPTVYACERQRGHTGSVFESGKLQEIGAILKTAGIDLIKENSMTIARSVLRDTYRILLMPDDGYRMLPGGEFEDCRLAPEHPIHAVTTYLSSVTGKYDESSLVRYLPMSNEPRPTTASWASLATWYRENIERGPPLLGFMDSPYEASIALAALGLLLSIGQRRRLGFALVGFVVFYHAAGSAFMGGVQPRYVVPIHPLMNLFAAVPLTQVVLIIQRLERFSFLCSEPRASARAISGHGEDVPTP